MLMHAPRKVERHGLLRMLYELGYSGEPISMKCDGAPELKEIRRQVAAGRATAIVPIDVPIRESTGGP